jgi:type IV secretory pathway TrbD component
MAEQPDGFEVPLYTGLQRVQTLAGAPRKFTILLATLAGIAILWHCWVALPILALVHGIAVWGTKQDDAWFAIVWSTLRQRHFYEG